MLVKETSLSHNEIFGREVTYETTVEQSRGSKLLDFLFGKKEKKVANVARGPGMRAQSLQAYLDLMNEHNERVKREREKNQMKNSLRKSA